MFYLFYNYVNNSPFPKCHRNSTKHILFMYNPILVYGESVMSVGIIIIIIIILDKLSVGIIIFYQKHQLLEWSTRKKN